MRNLAYLFVAFLSTFAWNQSFAQELFKQEFENKETYPVLVMRGTELLKKMDPQAIENISVREGDRITIKLPENLDFNETALYGVEPIYMSKERKGRIEIRFLKKFSEFEQRRGHKGLSMALNFKGVDLAKYDQMAVAKSFSQQAIFENLSTHNYAYKFQAGEAVPLGFDYTGHDNDRFGSDQVTTYSSARKFEEGFSVNVTGKAPIPKTPVTVGLGVGYSRSKNEASSEDDIYFSNFSGIEVYSVSLYEDDLVDVQLTRRFREAVKGLRSQAEVEDKIIRRFGTHYAESITYGGFFRSWKHISSRDYYEMERQGIDVSATVEVATPTEKKTMTNKNVNKQGSGFEEAVESTSGGAQGNGGFNFSHVTKSEFRDKLSRSNGNFRAVGGPGDHATAVKTQLVEIHKLVYPHVFKDGSKEKDLRQKREWIEKAVLAYLKREMTKMSPAKPAYKLYKAKLTRAKKVIKNLDDANQKMMGSIILKEPGTSNEYPLWKEDQFIMINEFSGELKLDVNQPWTIIKVPIVNGVPKDITINAEINLINLDDCCGNDPHVGSLPIRLKDINGIQDFTKTVTHTAFMEETHWEVKFVIREIPDLDSGPIQNVARRSATISNPVNYAPRSSSMTEQEFINATRSVVVSKGTGGSTTAAKVVKFHGQNGISMAQAKAIAAQNGWQIATSNEVQAAFQQHKLDVYAFGMMADGRFAVPVQRDYPNFKKGANIGASGGNQGFFYTAAATNTTSTSTKPATSTPPSNTMTPASPGFVRIQNSWKKTHYVHNQNGKLEDGQIQAGWWSSQWKIVPVHSGWVRIQNKWKPDQYLHNQNGKLEVGKIQPNWASAMWKIVPVHSGWVRIQNSWYKEHFIHNQNGKIEVGKIDPNWASAMWKVE